MYPKRLWAGFALPGVVWLILLFLVPFYAVIAVAFGNVDPLLQTPVPIWNPLDWNVGWMEQALSDLAPGGVYWGAVVRTHRVRRPVARAVLRPIGYPVAYYIARHARRSKNLLLILLILPFWISYLMRMLAWVNLLAADGLCHPLSRLHTAEQPRRHLGLLSQQDGWLNGQSFTVDPRAGLRLHPVLHPAAVRLARPHRQEPARGGP